MQNEAAFALDAYCDHIAALGEGEEKNRWSTHMLRSNLNSAHKFFIGVVPKSTKISLLVDILTEYFSKHLEDAKQAIDNANESFSDDEI